MNFMCFVYFEVHVGAEFLSRDDIMNDDYYVMWLSRVKGMNNKKFNKLIEYFGTAEKVFEADRSTLFCVCDNKTAINIYNSSRDGSLEKYLNELKKNGAEYISKLNKFYPEGLKNIDDKPIGIYYKGTLPEKRELLISIIGSRRCTEYGKAVSLKIAGKLAGCGMIIVSGLADGVDSYSSIGALKANGKTIGVMGTSIEKCYPAANRSLYDEIIEKGGCIISEHAPYEKTYKYDFVYRNRIIAALSRILIVVEAEDKSGTFSTVDAALNYGKSVFAVPGSVFSSYSRGTNRLIREGCPPLIGYEDILFELGIEQNEENESHNKKEERLLNVSKNGRLIIGLINNDPISMETLTSKTGLPIGVLQSELTILEVNGIIKRLPGQRYILVL